MKKLMVIKSYKEGETELAVDTEIEVSAEMAVELIEKGFAKEIEVKETEVKEADLNDLEDVVKELKSKIEDFEKKEMGDNKIMNIEVKEQAVAPETKLSNAVKVAKAIATGKWTEETKAIAGQGETVAGDGGALVDVEIVQGIYANAIASSQILPKVGQRPVGVGYNSFKIRQLNEANGTPADYNGVTLNVIAEGGAITPQKLGYTSDTVEINKLAAIVPFTSEILEDVPGIVAFTEAQVGAAFGMKIDAEILYGTDSLMTAAVGHAGSKAVTLADASAPTAAELREIYMAAINPTASEWIMSGAVYENLMALQLTNSNALLQPNYNVSPFGTMFGRPVQVVNCMKGANGQAGTIGFCDFSNGYLVGTKGGVKMARSVELYYLTDQEALRWILRVGGAPTKATTLTLADGRAVASMVFGHDA